MLHTVNKSPFAHGALDTCLDFVAKDEPILLFEDAVVAVQEGTKLSGKLANVIKSNPVYVLDADLQARGIQKTISGIKVIGYDGFVDLVAENKVQNWI